MQKTIGGDRLGSGKKMKVDLKNYERSTHNLGYIWRSTMSAGTLVPYMSEIGLPGDTFDIDLECDIKTHPTIGPLFGSYKVQLDVFMCPLRLYIGELNNNKLGVGMKMNQIKFPFLAMQAKNIDTSKDDFGMQKDVDNQQINPSSIFSYLNIRGLGHAAEGGDVLVYREFNAIPYLAYWDIYKNYYANKQEEIGAVIHNSRANLNENVENIDWGGITVTTVYTEQQVMFSRGTTLILQSTDGNQPDPRNIFIEANGFKITMHELMDVWTWNAIDEELIGTEMSYAYAGWGSTQVNRFQWVTGIDLVEEPPEVRTFPLENIDKMKDLILGQPFNNPGVPIEISHASIEPYNLAFDYKGSTPQTRLYSKMSSQEGLALKTYQSDLFNNWMSTEWIDGENGIAAITAVDTSGGDFTIDTLNLAKKVYNMLNRIAISGGSYDDWVEAVWTHDGFKKAQSPIYMGGLIKELVFQEITSNAASEENGESRPLGSLAGKGTMSGKHKGGKITVKVDEPSYIIGIISLTPRVDYSQGNKWDTLLRNMDELHKPALDEIGFQDLITDQMAWWDTIIPDGDGLELISAGKQPAWLNYMTNVNQVRGNFAIPNNQMWMTLNRRYEYNEEGEIMDLTTYIDPMKFNDIFAKKSRDAQNFWAQIALDITARRKMSAKIMPNL